MPGIAATNYRTVNLSGASSLASMTYPSPMILSLLKEMKKQVCPYYLGVYNLLEKREPK